MPFSRELRDSIREMGEMTGFVSLILSGGLCGLKSGYFVTIRAPTGGVCLARKALILRVAQTL